MSSSIALSRLGKEARLGPFRIVKELGAGGFAPVCLAVEEHGNVELRTVALKIFAVDQLSPWGRGRTAKEGILAEARALCSVEHPNVVRFFQIVEDPARHLLGLAMEHVRGSSLADRLDRERALSPPAVLGVGAALAAALAAVHGAGLVHRDVKPANVIETDDGYKLIDFGIAAGATSRPSRSEIILAPSEATAPAELLDAACADTARSDEADTVAGTMGYIDPVCIGRKARADATSDLYALGATLYEALTGRLPAAVEGGGLRRDIAFGLAPPPRVRDLAPSTPPDLARLVDSLVAPERKDRPRRAETVASEIERLRRVGRGESMSLPTAGPFRGLGPFQAEDRDVYFGRSGDVVAAVELLRTRGLVALVGSSGAGKSSLARAGVVPAVAEGAIGRWPEKWRTVAITPGRAPRAELEHAFGAFGLRMEDDTPEAFASRLAMRVELDGTGILVLVDQLEELATLSQPAEAAWTASFLAALATRPTPGLRAVVTARHDMLAGLLALPAIGAAIARGVHVVAPMTSATWLDALDDRLAVYGYTLEPGMRDELARELDDPSVASGSGSIGSTAALPLVEFALRRLWEKRDEERRMLSRAALAEMGGLGGALARHADMALAAIRQRGGDRAGDAARAVLVALTTPHGTRARRTRAELVAEASGDGEDVVGALERARLVVATDDGLTLAHDTLIAKWPTLRAWVEAIRRDREIAAVVEEAAERWKAQPGRDRLIRGRLLSEARSVIRGTVALSPDARQFVAASRRDELRATIGILSLASSIFVGAIVLLVVFRMSEQDAIREKDNARSLSRSLIQARDQNGTSAGREIERLLVEKRACEKQLAAQTAPK